MPPKPTSPRLAVPDWLLWAKREHSLSAETVLVLIAMCELGDDEWICSQSAANIAQCAGVARSSTQKAIARLVEVTAIVDLGHRSRREPRKYRVSPSRPPTAVQLRLLGTKATRRAANDDGSWLVSVE